MLNTIMLMATHWSGCRIFFIMKPNLSDTCKINQLSGSQQKKSFACNTNMQWKLSWKTITPTLFGVLIVLKTCGSANNHIMLETDFRNAAFVASNVQSSTANHQTNKMKTYYRLVGRPDLVILYSSVSIFSLSLLEVPHWPDQSFLYNIRYINITLKYLYETGLKNSHVLAKSNSCKNQVKRCILQH